MKETMSDADCHACGKTISHSNGCPDRVVICEKCRRIPKKLQAARDAMEAHLQAHRS